MVMTDTKTDLYTFVSRFFDRVDAYDKTATYDLVATDVQVHVTGQPTPLNRDQWWLMAEDFHRGFSGGKHSLVDVIAAGDLVTVRLVWGGRHQDAFMGVPASGRDVEVSGTCTFRMADGRIAESWMYFDALGMMRQLQPIAPGSTDVSANVALVKQGFEAINHPELQGIDSLLTPDYLHHDPGMPVPAMLGVEAYKGMMSGYRAAFPDFRLTLDRIYGHGDRVVSHWTFEGTHQAPLQEIPATGKQVKASGVTIHRICGGKAAEGWTNFDFASMMQQLGVIPTQA